MRLLLLGQTGQLAQEVLALAARMPGLAVRAAGRAEVDLDRPEAAARAVAALLDAAGPGARFDAVLNAAAWTAVDRAEAEAAAAFRANAEAPGLIAAGAAARGVPFLHVSTDYVFDGRPGPAWREQDAPAPLNAYGRSKLAGERAVLAAAGEGAAILRTSWVFSRFGSNFVQTMRRLGAERPELRVVDDQRGGPMPAAALAAALVRLAGRLSRGEGPGGLYHLAGRPVVSWAEFAAAIMAAAGLPARVVPVPAAAWPAAARRPVNSALDCGRLLGLHGIAAPDWRPALRAVLDPDPGPDPRPDAGHAPEINLSGR